MAEVSEVKAEQSVSAARGAVMGLLFALACYGIFSFPGFATRWIVTISACLVLTGWTAIAALALPLARGVRIGLGWGVALVFLGAACRVVMAMIFAGHQAGGDAHCYLVIAQNLLGGKGYVIDDPYIGPGLRALFPPAYATLLAGWSLLAGFSTVSLSLLNVLIDTITALLLARLGRRLGFAPAGRAAAWLYLIWPSVLLSSALAQKEGLINLLVLLLAHYWVTPGRMRSYWRDGLALGVPTGLLALTQPNLAPLSLLMGLMFIPRDGLAIILRRGVAGLAVAVLVMMPWWLRNWLVFGAFVPMTTSGGVSLWIGNNSGVTGDWIPPPVFAGLSEYDYMTKVGAIARHWIIDNPFDFVRLTATKFVRATAIAITGLVRLDGLTPPLTPGVTALFLPVAQATHSALLAAGAIALRFPKFYDGGIARVVALLAASGLQLVLFDCWFEFSERHCEFVKPFLILIACTVVSRFILAKPSQKI